MDGTFAPYDFIVAQAEQDPQLKQAHPEQTWEHIFGSVGPADAFLMGVAAFEHALVEVAAAALRELRA